jgi:site-specific recombinase XerD
MSPTLSALRSPLAAAIARFLDHKRVLGRRYDTEAGALRLFDRYLVEHQIATVAETTPAVIDAFLRSRPRRRPRSFNHLRGVLARFFSWLVSRDLVPSSPVRTPKRPGSGSRIPFILSPDQVRVLVEEAAHLRAVPGTTHRGATYRAVFVVLYALGLRVSEVCRLNVADLDRRQNVLLIRHSKFGKDRLVPFGPRVAQLLEHYLDVRRRRCPSLCDDAPLFTVGAGRRLNRHSIDRVFGQLVPRLHLVIPADASRPRVHDLRHACAVTTLLRWYRTGVNPAARLLHLSTFLGHVQPESTAVYLTITADLLAEASGRFEQLARPLFTEGRP